MEHALTVLYILHILFFACMYRHFKFLLTYFCLIMPLWQKKVFCILLLTILLLRITHLYKNWMSSGTSSWILCSFCSVCEWEKLWTMVVGLWWTQTILVTNSSRQTLLPIAFLPLTHQAHLCLGVQAAQTLCISDDLLDQAVVNTIPPGDNNLNCSSDDNSVMQAVQYDKLCYFITLHLYTLILRA